MSVVVPSYAYIYIQVNSWCYQQPQNILNVVNVILGAISSHRIFLNSINVILDAISNHRIQLYIS